MWKTVVAGTTALVIGGTALAYAHPGQGKGGRAQGWRPSAEDITAYGAARIAALKAGLELTAEQEKLWPPVASAMQELAKQRAERVAARIAARKDAKAPTDPMERLDRRADAMQSRGAALKKFAEAAKPLYDSLDDAQKRRFTVLARAGMRGHHGWRGRHHHRHGGWHHRGPQGPRFGGPERGPGPQ